MKGGSALYTAKAVYAGPVSGIIAREWGEAFWTAPDLCKQAFDRALDDAAIRGLFGLRRSRTA